MPRSAIPAFIIFSFSLFTPTFLTPASGQSLADLARQERDRKKNASEASQVYTGEKESKLIGCFQDREARDLSGATTEADDMTGSNCQAFCQEKGFSFAGTQWGKQCFCGNTFGKYGKILDSKCSSNCGGNQKEKCGGWWANTVYTTGTGSGGAEAASENEKRQSTADKAASSLALMSPPPKGALNARPADQLSKAWADRSLWIKNPPLQSGAECIDFHAFKDCEIWSVDEQNHLSRKGARMCEVREFTADTSDPGHVPGDYGLIIGGTGGSFTASFPQTVTPTTRTFATRSQTGSSFEVFDGPCAKRAAN